MTKKEVLTALKINLRDGINAAKKGDQFNRMGAGIAIQHNLKLLANCYAEAEKRTRKKTQ
mgnify:CR=1 FL=1